MPSLKFDIEQTRVSREAISYSTDQMDDEDYEIHEILDDESSYFHFKLMITRPTTIRFFSILVIILMWVLSVLFFTVALIIVFGLDSRPDSGFLGESCVLLFALPELRGVMPNVPPIGIIIDAVGFYW